MMDRPGDDGPPTDAEGNLARLEAVLFLSREPLTSRKLSQYANLADGTQARTLIRRLNERYDAAGRAFRVEQVAGGYQLLTRRKLAPWLRRLAHVPGETRLSAPALETLAVIAYRQPVPRADIEAIRGVNCGEILRQLMDRDLVRIGGRSEELGRPYLYATTKRFLQVFGLNNAEDLPERDMLRGCPLPAAPPILPAANESASESGVSDNADLADELDNDLSDEEYETDFSDG
jgi:segregation and condensation protein B